MHPFASPLVEAHFAAYPKRVKTRMLALRELVFETAARTEGVGELTETMKWGEPAYLTAQTGSGSTLRMDWKSRQPEQCALYFNCQTNLLERFRAMATDGLRFEGNRAVLMPLTAAIPKEAIVRCIEASLTYHASKKPRTSWKPKESS